MCGYKPRHAPLVGSRLRTRSGSLAMLLEARGHPYVSFALDQINVHVRRGIIGGTLDCAHSQTYDRRKKIRASCRRFEMCKTYAVDYRAICVPKGGTEL
jgi:hypothetical protein